MVQMVLHIPSSRSKLKGSSLGGKDAAMTRTVAVACTLLGVGAFLFVTSGIIIVQQGRLHGRLGIIVALAALLGAYCLWVDVVKGASKKEG